MSTRLPTGGHGGSSSLPKYITLYVLLAGIGGGLFFVILVLYCCKVCMGRRLVFENVLPRDSVKDTEATAGTTGTGTAGERGTNGSGTGYEKKAVVVQYSGGGTQILTTTNTGGLQRKISEEHQGFRSSLSRSPRDTGDGFYKSNNNGSGGGGRDDNHFKNTATPPHSPHFLGSTVISIEPSRHRSISQSSSSSSLQLDHHSTQNSELPSPRSPRSRQNSGGSSLSRCGSRGSQVRDPNRASMKSIPSRTSSFRRPVGGSLKDCKGHPRRNRGGSSGDPYLTINTDISPRRSVSLRSPRHGHSPRSPQSKEGNLLSVGLYIGSESSVHAARDRNDHKKFNPSPTMSTHSVLSGQWTPLEVGLEWWKRKHKLQLVQHENEDEKITDGSKVRYNDVGSMEDIRDSDISDLIFPDSNEETKTPTIEVQPNQIKHQYRALWELRATLEEEDWAAAKNPPKVARMLGGPSLSPTIPPKEDTQALLASAYSTEQSPDRDPLSSYTTSFESNTEPVFDVMSGGVGGNPNHKETFHHLGPTSQASLVARRQSYKNVLHNRMKRLERSASIMHETGNVTETTTSFDSIETQESTSTDTSRLEAITTSIESTDNTDSATDTHHLHYGAHHKIHLRCDSGYKSMENSGVNTGSSTVNSSSPNANHPQYHGTSSARHLLPRRCLSSGSSVEAGPNLVQGKTPLTASFSGGSSRIGNPRNSENMLMGNDFNPPVLFAKVSQSASQLQSSGSGGNNTGTQSSLSSSSSSANTCATTITANSNRNVSRKRRDFGRFERHSIGSLDSVREPLDDENASTCDSMHTRGGSVKGSLFYRYFRNPRSNSAYYTRDYSIDEKSDQLFREFSRCDPSFDIPPFSATRQSPKIYSRRHSARGAMSMDLGSTRMLPSSRQTSPVSMTYSGVTSPTSKFLIRKGSGSHPHHPHVSQDHHDDENHLLPDARGVLLPSMRFHGVGGHTSIPIITVDDS